MNARKVAMAVVGVAALAVAAVPAVADSTAGLTLDTAVPSHIDSNVAGFTPATVGSVFVATTSKALAEVRVLQSPVDAQPAAVELLPTSSNAPDFTAASLATATRTGSEPAPNGWQWDTYDFSRSGLSLVAGHHYAVAWRIGNGVNLATNSPQAGPYLGEAYIDFDQGGVAPYWYWGTPIYEVYTNPGAVQAVSEQVTGASLGLVSSPGAVTPPAVTLNGVDEITPSFTLPLDIGDATGSGNGWNVSLNATPFTDAHSRTLGALYQSTEPVPTCDASTTCTPATDASKLVSLVNPLTYSRSNLVQVADVATGMGDQSVSPTFTLAVPANSYAGTYTSTWTVSLTSAPH